MKPYLLEMNAFGPYGKNEKIDFSVFNNEGIFLITGDTGSGKSTVFDAISFALYGEGSQGKDKRQAKSFISDYSGLKEETYVRFSFYHQNKLYEIIRYPEQERYKKKGEGVLVLKARATLKDISNNIIYEGINEVNEKIMALIGLDKHQFNQTVMIAQNDFLKILNASSKDRSELLKKIFNTSLYNNIQESLKIKDRLLNDRVTDLKKQFNNILGKLNLSDTVIDNIQQTIKDVTQEIKSHEMELSSLTKSNSILQNQIDVLQQSFKEAMYINDLFNQLEKHLEVEKQLISEQLIIDEAKKRFLLAKKANEMVTLSSLKNSHIKEIKHLEKEISTLKEDLKTLDYEFINYKEAFEDLPKLKEKLNKKQIIENEYENLIPLIEKIENINKQIFNLNKVLSEKLIVLKEKNLLLSDLKEKYYQNQAGILASNLKAGESCPVCGSKDHPLLAKMVDKTVDRNYLINFEKELKKLEDDINKDTLNLNKLKDSKENYMNSFKDRKMEDIKTDYQILKNENIKLNKQILKIEKEYNEHLQILIKNKNTLENYEIQLNNTEKKLKEIILEFEDKLLALNFKNEAEYLSNLMEKPLLEKLENKINDYDKLKIVNDSKLETIKLQIKDKEKQDLDAIKIKIDQTKISFENNQKQYNDINFSLKNKLLYLKDLQTIDKDFQSIKQEWYIIHELNEVVNGQISNAMKITFETYVQRYYFKQVVNAANKRLKTLTKEIFVLRCKDDAKNKKTQSGLDLEVLDKNTGFYRDVNTMSGGESFMASLSLALGLSDVVQANSGKVRIESMFIDEGFGSLDEKALNNAIDMLITLADKKRLVGIISHVESLKNRINNQIIINKYLDGSKITVKQE